MIIPKLIANNATKIREKTTTRALSTRQKLCSRMRIPSMLAFALYSVIFITFELRLVRNPVLPYFLWI